MKLYKNFINEKINNNSVNYEKIKLLVEKIEELLNKLGEIQKLSRWNKKSDIKKAYNDDIYDIIISYSFHNHRSQYKRLYVIKMKTTIENYVILDLAKINEYAFYGGNINTDYIFKLLKFVDDGINSIFEKYSDRYKYNYSNKKLFMLKDIDDIILDIDKVIIDLELTYNTNKYNL